MYDIDKAPQLEKLAVAQAFANAFGSLVATGNKGNLRGMVDAAMKEKYEKEGAKTFDVRVNGKKVGSYSITVNKEVHTTELEVTHSDAFEAWAIKSGLAHKETVKREMTVFDKDEQAILKQALKDGEVPDGCEFKITDREESYKNATLRGCKPDEVAAALGGSLQETAAALLSDTTEGE